MISDFERSVSVFTADNTSPIGRNQSHLESPKSPVAQRRSTLFDDSLPSTDSSVTVANKPKLIRALTVPSGLVLKSASSRLMLIEQATTPIESQESETNPNEFIETRNALQDMMKGAADSIIAAWSKAYTTNSATRTDKQLSAFDKLNDGILNEVYHTLRVLVMVGCILLVKQMVDVYFIDNIGEPPA